MLPEKQATTKLVNHTKAPEDKLKVKVTKWPILDQWFSSFAECFTDSGDGRPYHVQASLCHSLSSQVTLLHSLR